MARVLVIGPGAIGSWCGATIARGNDVTMAVRSASQVNVLRSQGLIAQGPGGAHRPVEVTADPQRLMTRKPFDLVLLATKCTDAADALAAWRPAVRDAPVVSMQNGLMHDELVGHVQGELIDAVVAFPATLEAPGHSIRTGPGGFIVSAGAEDLLGPLKLAGPVSGTDNLLGAKWTKLLINGCITGLGAVTGESLGTLLADRRARDAFLGMVAEGRAVGQAAGIEFEPVQKFRVALFDGNGAVPRPAQHAMLRILGRKFKQHRSSSLQSIERGRSSEVAYLNGRIAAEGDKHGIATPFHDAVVAEDARLARENQSPSEAFLGELPLA